MNYTKIDGNIEEYQNLAMNLLNIYNIKNKPVLIGIDGCGGSGKSTFAQNLNNYLDASTIVHMDDFYMPSDSNKKEDNTQVGVDFDWRRLEKQVIKPIKSDLKNFSYQKYNWIDDKVNEKMNEVMISNFIIIEGVYSTREELRKYYDFNIWVECPYDIRLKRGIERDGEERREMWVNNWMIAENKYIELYKPINFANLIIDGTK